MRHVATLVAFVANEPGCSPLLAGSALLPVTAIMLVLSARAGALSDPIGPRLPMRVGPLVAAGGVLLLVRVGPHASYATDILPAVTVFGLGLAFIVAPLTTTVLAAAEARQAGIVSGSTTPLPARPACLPWLCYRSLQALRATTTSIPMRSAPGFGPRSS